MTSEEQRLISQVTASFRAFSGTTGALRLRITSPSQVEVAAKPSLHEELRLIYDEHTIRRDESSSSLSRVLPGAYAGRGLLTRGECETLMREAIDRGMRHVEQGRRCGTSIKVKADGSVTDARLRDCTRTELLHPELADKMFERLRPHLESEVTVDGSESAHALGLPASDPMLHGVWRPSRVNPMIRICRYPGDGRGHFGPHQDSSFEVGPHERSLLTINGYLNALPEGAGGCTRFLIDDLPVYKDARGRFTVEDESSVLGRIRPDEPGMAAVFYHGLMHDSEPLRSGAPPKWIYRTEVIYTREPSSVPAIRTEAALAREIERAAERIERSDPTRSVRLYQLAQRLNDGRMDEATARRRLDELRPREREEEGEDTDDGY